MGALLVWSCFGTVDIIAEAPGRLVPNSLIKLVQPSEMGSVAEVLVSEGQAVRKGAVLLRLDSTSAAADLAAAKIEEKEASLRLRRVRAELMGQKLVRQADDPMDLFARTLAHYDARRIAHETQVAQEKAGVSRLQADVAAATETKAKLASVLPSYLEAEAAYRAMGDLQLQSKLAVQERVRDRIEHERDLRSQTQTLQGLIAALNQQQLKVTQLESDYNKELRQEEADLIPRLERAHQEHVKQSHRVSQLELTAPSDGIVKDLAVHAPGTVVSPGAVLMTLIPTNDTLSAEVWVRNEDSGFVSPGQAVRLKIAAYPFQKYGLLHGKVLRVSPDSSDANASSSLATPALTTTPTNSNIPPQYKVLVALESQKLIQDGKVFPLRAGMQLNAEINQGKRTVMEYLLSPVRKVVDEAARER
ncbi:hypothetical protein WJ87_05900 [Burkholderia ubonensis]|nr:hypothetical protein WJ87_05900 [Burkholderia ubonensis]